MALSASAHVGTASTQLASSLPDKHVTGLVVRIVHDADLTLLPEFLTAYAQDLMKRLRNQQLTRDQDLFLFLVNEVSNICSVALVGHEQLAAPNRQHPQPFRAGGALSPHAMHVTVTAAFGISSRFSAWYGCTGLGLCLLQCLQLHCWAARLIAATAALLCCAASCNGGALQAGAQAALATAMFSGLARRQWWACLASGALTAATQLTDLPAAIPPLVSTVAGVLTASGKQEGQMHPALLVVVAISFLLRQEQQCPTTALGGVAFVAVSCQIAHRRMASMHKSHVQ